jgi:hypothetical protein
MVAYRSSPRNTRKMNLQPILNKTLPLAHRVSKFDMLGVAGDLMKYSLHFFKK